MDNIHSAVSALDSTPVLSASASGTSITPQRWMQKQTSVHALRPSLNDNQRTSLSAMIGYISHKSGQSEFRLERILSDHFNIPNVKCLLAHDFDEAIRYLADIVAVKG